MNFAYSVGDSVIVKDYGIGIVAQIDEKSKDFTYLVKFPRRGIAWLNEKRISPLTKEETYEANVETAVDQTGLTSAT